jgi:hypothetical protein
LGGEGFGHCGSFVTGKMHRASAREGVRLEGGRIRRENLRNNQT